MLDDNIYIYVILGLNGFLLFYIIRLFKCVLCCVFDMKECLIEYFVILLLVKILMISYMVYYVNYYYMIYYVNNCLFVVLKFLNRMVRIVNFEFIELE